MPLLSPNAPKRPSHRAVASLDTNASGIADSTISFAGSAWSSEGETFRISQFPPPPLGLPSSPPQSIIGTPPFDSGFSSPSSRGFLLSGDEAAESPVLRKKASLGTSRLNPSLSAGVASRHAYTPGTPYIRERPSHRSFAGLDRELVYAERDAPVFTKDMPTNFVRQKPSSPSAASFNSSVENVLSNSVISSLLSGPDQNERPNKNSARGGGRANKQPHQPARGPQSTPSPKPTTPGTPNHNHDTRPLSGASEYYPPIASGKEASPVPRMPSRFIGRIPDAPSTLSNGASVMSETTLHSEEQQIQTAVRTSIFRRDSEGIKVIGVVPAYTLRTFRTSASTKVASVFSTSFPPPKHQPDTPQSVSGHGLDNDFDDVIEKQGTFSSDAPLAGPSGSRPRRSKSMRSVKSYMSSIVSRISRSTGSISVRQPGLAWLRGRPLPPLPSMPHIYTSGPDDDIRKVEDDIPLPQLMKRAGALAEMLERKRRSAQRRTLPYGYKRESTMGQEPASPSKESPPGTPGFNIINEYLAEPSIPQGWFNRPYDSSANSNRGEPERQSLKQKLMSPRYLRVIIAVVILAILVIIAISVGVVVGQNNTDKHRQCSGNFTGASCDLDATCVCSSSNPAQCNQLAQSLLSLIPTINTLFNANFTPTGLSTQVWNAIGSPVGNNCASQASLIDVAPALQASTHPNRTEWARAAILWNLALSADLTAATNMRTFVTQTRWNDLNGIDGPVFGDTSKFSFNQSGFTFDFASQTVLVPQISFQTEGSVSNNQISRVNIGSGKVLDRMYSFALASSTQRQKYLRYYWQNTLQQQPSDLTKFLNAIRSAPFLLPFDATSQPIIQFLNNTPASFPPPLSCYPGLNSSQIGRINKLETTVFDLPPCSGAATQNLDASCFSDRPTYGVVDLLRLRLPFVDGRQGVGKQAVVLSQDAISRAVVYRGEKLSALPGATNVTALQPRDIDPRQYGTVDHMDHVVLEFLKSIPDATLATSLINFVLQGNTVPPANNSRLFSSLSSIPTLEFAILGSVVPADLTSSVSSFSTPSGSLFFGSDGAQIFRSWALKNSSSVIAWTETAVSPLVVRENAANDALFQSVWTPATLIIQAGITDPSVIGNITRSFSSLGLFSP